MISWMVLSDRSLREVPGPHTLSQALMQLSSQKMQTCEFGAVRPERSEHLLSC